jgi:hypothetical protein
MRDLNKTLDALNLKIDIHPRRPHCGIEVGSTNPTKRIYKMTRGTGLTTNKVKTLQRLNFALMSSVASVELIKSSERPTPLNFRFDTHLMNQEKENG